MANPQTLKSHHELYIRDNHKTQPLNKIKNGLDNLRLFWSENRIKNWLKAEGLSWIESPKKDPDATKKKNRQNHQNWHQKKKKEERDNIIKKVLQKHYPSGGAKIVKEHLNKSDIYLTTAQINYQARRFGISRDRSLKLVTTNKSIPTSQILQGAYYTIEDFNERYGTNFQIYSRGLDVGEVIDSYISIERGEAMVKDLVGRLFMEGYAIQKGKGHNFYVWGDE